MQGASIGGEAALVIAAPYPQIKVVIAAVPSKLVWPGVSADDQQPPATFTRGGKPLAYLPYGWSGAFRGVYALYEDGLKSLAQHADSIIPVERINGPVLLVCGQQDAIWPSCVMSRQIVARLRAKHFRPAAQILENANAGHAVFGIPLEISNSNYSLLGSLGGTPEGNNLGRKTSWPKALQFIDTALKR